jgi:hypothetical protein
LAQRSAVNYAGNMLRLTPGLSRVVLGRAQIKPLYGFAPHALTPLNRQIVKTVCVYWSGDTGLKPGVNV